MISYGPRPLGQTGTRFKFIRGATSAPLVEVDDLSDLNIDRWRQVDLVNATDTNLAAVVGIAEHPTKKTVEYYFWYHQTAFILSGEAVVQDLDNGAVYRGHEGDLFYWAPGLHMRLGGVFRAYFVKTPIPNRWVRVDGKKKGIEVLNLKDEITYPGTPPDEVRKEATIQAPPTTRPRMKFIRGAANVAPVEVDEMPKSGVVEHGEVYEGALINPVESDLVLDVVIAQHSTKEPLECDHRWHQIVLILDGEMVSEDLDAGAVYRGHRGDLFYWGPGLRHTVGGQFRVLAIKMPPPRRWVKTPSGTNKLYMVNLQDELFYPASPPDEIRKEPLYVV